jgi:hypothetical protein
METTTQSTETAATINRRIEEARTNITTARAVYEVASLDALEGNGSASAVTTAAKAMEAAKQLVSSLTAASAAAEARAARQKAAADEAAKVAAIAAKKGALEVLRSAAAAWDDAVANLRGVTNAYEDAEKALRTHMPTPAEHSQLEAARNHALPIIEHHLSNYTGAPKLMPFLRGHLLTLVGHIPKA